MKLVEIPAPEFDLAITLDSGQVFHWDNVDSGFVGAIGDRPIYVEQRGDSLVTSWEDEKLIRNYFALDHPLAEICASFPNDPAMKAARKFCRGLRVIRQPKWECLATFICSSMKQVAHIRQISRKLRERFGQTRQIDPPSSRLRRGKASQTIDTFIVYTFPSAERIAQSSEKELRKCALGYRAKNLLVTARVVASGDVDLEKLGTLSNVDLRARLCELPGVGAKVANCVMLFAYERLSAFPIDVWIERILREKYFPRARKLNAKRLQAFTQKYFGDHGGYAQQYLFHHARTTKRKRKGRSFVTISGVR
ncbi:MAG: 8-oxoguanine DNA glycosylase [Verrucomicrobiota bacterium]|nr:8-oxoguanine DNA glycosylase [Verrucomicrobiota bacterium]